MPIHSFEPVIDQNSELIILGSMPSVESLKQQQYYANPRNQFWSIVCSLFEMEVEAPHDDRIELLKENRIALWDVLASCDRQGSSDANIKNPVPNDFNKLFQKYRNLKYLFFNGTKAASLFEKIVTAKSSIIIVKTLPSTSPARAMPFDKKMEEWAVIKKYLIN